MGAFMGCCSIHWGDLRHRKNGRSSTENLRLLFQGFDLQLIHQSVQLWIINSSPFKFCDAGSKREIMFELCQDAIETNGITMCPKRFTYLPRELTSIFQKRIEIAILLNPFGRRLLANTGNRWQVIAWITTQRCEIWVLLRCQSILIKDCRRRHSC